MKYRVIDMYEDVYGELIYESDDLLQALIAAENHCIDTDDECKLIIKTYDGINIMFGDRYYDFTGAIDLLHGLYRAGILN